MLNNISFNHSIFAEISYLCKKTTAIMEARLSCGEKHEIIYTDAADGRKLRAEYRINIFSVVECYDEFGEMDDM